jgi:hypothetical protein
LLGDQMMMTMIIEPAEENMRKKATTENEE